MFRVGDQVQVDHTNSINHDIDMTEYPSWVARGLIGTVTGVDDDGFMVLIQRGDSDAALLSRRLKLSEHQKTVIRRELEDMRNMLYSNKEGE